MRGTFVHSGQIPPNLPDNLFVVANPLGDSSREHVRGVHARKKVIAV